jgi:hypothetical protein
VVQHDQGAYTTLLRAPSSLSVTSNPPGAHVCCDARPRSRPVAYRMSRRLRERVFAAPRRRSVRGRAAGFAARGSSPRRGGLRDGLGWR